MIATLKPLLYARVLSVHGSTVDRRTPTYKSERGLLRGIRKEIKRLPGRGPYMVERYESGKRVTVTWEG